MKPLRTRHIVVATTAAAFLGLRAYAAVQPRGTVHEQFSELDHGYRVHLHLKDGRDVHGKVVDVHDNIADIHVRGQHAPIAVDEAMVNTMQSRDTLRSHFHVGPCVDPITLALASPIIVATHLAGY